MKNFKYLQIMIVVLSISLVSCSKDDDFDQGHDFHLEKVNVVSAELPQEFNFGSTYEMIVTASLPNSCYFYYDQLDYVYEGTSRLIYPIAHVDDGISCNLNVTETTFPLRVTALQIEPYIFKFYQGKDADGKEMFLTIEVPVRSRNQKNLDNLKTSDTDYK